MLAGVTVLMIEALTSMTESGDVQDRLRAIEEARVQLAKTELTVLGVFIEKHDVQTNGSVIPLGIALDTIDDATARGLPRRDPWHSEYVYWREGDAYVIVSGARDGKVEVEKGSIARRISDARSDCPLGDDLIFVNGWLCNDGKTVFRGVTYYQSGEGGSYYETADYVYGGSSLSTRSGGDAKAVVSLFFRIAKDSLGSGGGIEGGFVEFSPLGCRYKGTLSATDSTRASLVEDELQISGSLKITLTECESGQEIPSSQPIEVFGVRARPDVFAISNLNEDGVFKLLPFLRHWIKDLYGAGPGVEDR